MKSTVWDAEIIAARVVSRSQRLRYEAGSPNPEEIALYANAVSRVRAGTCLVLGMTPELRAMLAGYFARVVAVDASSAAIVEYGSWVESPCETVVCADWLQFLEQTDETFDAVAGDGIFGNLCGRDAGRRLLQKIESRLAPGGVFVTRMALVPNELDESALSWPNLVRQFRAGRITEPEFGLSIRLFGFHSRFWNPENGMLDCGGVYGEIDKLHSCGELTGRERDVARRYLFLGKNWLPAEAEWVGLLTEQGWNVARQALHGRLWNAYYPVYVCVKSRTGYPQETQYGGT